MSSAPGKQLLFVYGSLKRGFSNHRQLSHAEFVGECRTERGYRLLLFEAYPALTADGEHEIHGELYLVDEATLAALDVFEGEAYRRSSILLSDGRRAQAYLLVPELLEHAVLTRHNRWL